MQTDLNTVRACAIVITYNPELSVLLRLIGEIGNQCDLLLIDNASSNASDFISIVEGNRRCIGVRQLAKNVGLASAMNLGLKEIQEAGYSLAVLFDQDSLVPVSFFSDMKTALKEAEARLGPRVAAVGPRVRNPHSGKQMPFKLFNRLFNRSDVKVPGSEKLFQADFLISSGCLLVLKHLNSVGLMKDSYFIDNIDLEWCFRAKANDFVTVGTDHSYLLHSIGEPDDNPLVQAGIMVSHSPLRSYYSTRNRFDLYRQRHAPLGWKLRDMPRFLLKTLWLVLFSKQRKAYWDNICKGIADSKGLQ